MQLERRPITARTAAQSIPLPARNVILRSAGSDVWGRPSQSACLRLRFLSIRIHGARPSVWRQARPAGSTSSDAGNAFNQLILPAMFFATCIVARIYRISARRLWRALIPMAPFLLVMVLSTLWSDYPELTLRRASRELLEAIALVMLAACFSNAAGDAGSSFPSVSNHRLFGSIVVGHLCRLVYGSGIRRNPWQQERCW